ncbi:MAG: phosphotransferase [Leptolyngbya sp. SIO3F4]|nr:phosphotransferase [Leptolyngbya sp. SIO3F4]
MQRQHLQAQLQQQIIDEYDKKLAHSIFATTDILTISDLLNRFCQEQFGHTIATCTFAYLSVGATFVVQLTNDTELVLKANGPQYDITALTASCNIQTALAEQGFPCPTVLRLPQRFDGTLLTAQTFCDPGERVNPTESYILPILARHLAKLIQHTKSLPQQGLPPWMDLHQTQLWHKPHNVLFDFEKTASGAEWIDDIARQAKQILRGATGPLVIGHSDWSLQNMSFRQGQLTCVYDWDSLRVGLEPCIVGGAARCFHHDWRYGPPKTAIRVDEVLDFVAAYETERGQVFSQRERQVLGAAVVYTAAYGLRCAHPPKGNDEHYNNSKRQLQRFTEAFLG